MPSNYSRARTALPVQPACTLRVSVVATFSRATVATCLNCDTLPTPVRAAVPAWCCCGMQLDKVTADAAELKAGYDKLAVDSSEQKAQLDKAAADATEYKAGYDKLLVDTSEQRSQLDKASADAAEFKAGYDKLLVDTSEQRAQVCPTLRCYGWSSHSCIT